MESKHCCNKAQHYSRDSTVVTYNSLQLVLRFDGLYNNSRREKSKVLVNEVTGHVSGYPTNRDLATKRDKVGLVMMNPLDELLKWLHAVDFAVLEHRFAKHGRDYVVYVEDCLGSDPGQHEIIFTHCVKADCQTRVRDS